MKKTLLTAFVVIASSSFWGCATPSMTGPNALKGWSRFVGEPVVSVQEVYPDGDAPRNLIKTKTGMYRIY